MNGTVDVYIPLRHDGERMTGIVPKGQRAAARKVRSIDVRTFLDPLADRNLENAIPAPKAKAYDPRIAPRGWRLAPPRPIAPEPVARRQPPTIEVRTGRCGKTFRTPAGYAWHLANIHMAQVRA